MPGWIVVDGEPEWDGDAPDEQGWDDCPPFESPEEATFWAWLLDRSEQVEPEQEAAA